MGHLLETSSAEVVPNIRKQGGTGHSVVDRDGAIHLVVSAGYDAAATNPSSRPEVSSLKVGSNCVGDSSSSDSPISILQGEPAETIADKTRAALTGTATATASTTTAPNDSSSSEDHSVMRRDGPKLSLNLADKAANDNANDKEVLSTSLPTAATAVRPELPQPSPPLEPLEPLKWDWEVEHADRKRERKEDAAFHHGHPFEVDRRLLKDVVREKMGREVGRIKFLSAGTFHKAYLVTLVNHEEVVARVARRFMPRLKTESEVATLSYLREKTKMPVPKIYHYDSNPYNRLGGEFILMSKAPGIPLSQVYHGLAYNDLVKLVKSLVAVVIPLFAHRFTGIGSLYFGPDPQAHAPTLPGSPTPKATLQHYSGFPFSPTLDMVRTPSSQSVHTITHQYHVGPIISWPFFGSNRGELVHPDELNRGPWSSVESYLDSCAEREVNAVLRENEGSSAPHRLHLDPDEIHSSRHHRLRAVPGDESDDSDEYNLEESEEEWEGPGDAMYRDYRRMQRSTFLVAHLNQRHQAVKREMSRWKDIMERLVKQVEKEGGREEFGLDCHDLSLENVFVDAEDHTKITCIIDWESTTTRPLWACAHVPACIQSSAFVSKLFRAAVAELPSDPTFHLHLPQNRSVDIARVCREWLYYEAAGTRLRMAHRCAEWDGWEEGLVDSILGPEEIEAEWFKTAASAHDNDALQALIASPKPWLVLNGASGRASGRLSIHSLHPHPSYSQFSHSRSSLSPSPARGTGYSHGQQQHLSHLSHSVTLLKDLVPKVVQKAARVSSKLPFVVEEQEKEKMLKKTGDICGGRGGELGRRLEAWLTVGEGGNGVSKPRKKWDGADEEDHEDHDDLQDHHAERELGEKEMVVPVPVENGHGHDPVVFGPVFER